MSNPISMQHTCYTHPTLDAWLRQHLSAADGRAQRTRKARGAPRRRRPCSTWCSESSTQCSPGTRCRRPGRRTRAAPWCPRALGTAAVPQAAAQRASASPPPTRGCGSSSRTCPRRPPAKSPPAAGQTYAGRRPDTWRDDSGQLMKWTGPHLLPPASKRE